MTKARKARNGETAMSKTPDYSKLPTTATMTTFPKGTATPEAPTLLAGTFGDKALHGSKLLYDTAKASTTKEAFEGKALHWAFAYWGCANAADVEKLLKAKPDMVVDLVNTALGTKARAQSWAAVRGGAVTVDVKVDGKTYERVNAEFVEMLKAAGKRVEIIPRVSKASK